MKRYGYGTDIDRPGAGIVTIQYRLPQRWIAYDPGAIGDELTGAKVAVLALTQIPCQRPWAEAPQEKEFKREVAGTSRIEGAEFTETDFYREVNRLPTATTRLVTSQ